MRWLAVAAISLSLGSCSALDDKSDAEAQVAAFHRAYDAQRFEALFDGASPVLKEITPKARFVGFLTEVHDRLGPVKSADQQSWKVNYNTGSSQATLVYRTSFAKGAATETFQYEAGPKPRLVGYYIQADGPTAN